MSEAPRAEQVPKSDLETDYAEFRVADRSYRAGDEGAPTLDYLIVYLEDLIQDDLDESDKPFPELPEARLKRKVTAHAPEFDDIEHRFDSPEGRKKAKIELTHTLMEEVVRETKHDIRDVLRARKRVV
jgi:hypothetical protein